MKTEKENHAHEASISTASTAVLEENGHDRPAGGDGGLHESPDARSRQILSAMVAFRDGKFSGRLPGDWDGSEGGIAEAFNQTIDYEDRVAREVARLSVTVGKEGRLKQ